MSTIVESPAAAARLTAMVVLPGPPLRAAMAMVLGIVFKIARSAPLSLVFTVLKGASALGYRPAPNLL
jgi:hypothetical protein